MNDESTTPYTTGNCMYIRIRRDSPQVCKGTEGEGSSLSRDIRGTFEGDPFLADDPEILEKVGAHGEHVAQPWVFSRVSK